MRYFLIAAILLVSNQLTLAQGTVQPQPSAAGSMSEGEESIPVVEGRTRYIDYQSVYEASTLAEEVKMAAERFNLTPAQQEVWSGAAVDRRAVERSAREKLADPKIQNYEKDGVYRGMRLAQNNFHETVTGYLSPVQKQAMETDRLILQEKQKRLAKIPPPPPPTVTVTPIDSTAIKEEMKAKEKGKGKGKSRKKKG